VEIGGQAVSSLRTGKVKFFNQTKGFGRVAGGDGGGGSYTGRRRVEVLKSNKQGDPNANRLSASGISGIRGHRDVGGYRSTAAGVWGKIKRDLSIEVERRSGGF